MRTRLLAVLSLGLLAAACGGGDAGTAPTPQPKPVASVIVQPSALSLTVGQTGTLAAEARDVSGAALAGRTITWSTSDAAIATVSTAGAVTAIAPGTATITATSEGKTGTAAVTVSPVPAASVVVTPPADTLYPTQTSQFVATVKDSAGGVLSGRTVAWATSNGTVATVSTAGILTAVGVGSTTLTATVEGKSGSATVRVIPVPVASVTVTPATLALIVGQTGALTATANDASGGTLNDRTTSWASSAPAIASVSTQGVVTALAPGTVTITATSEGKGGFATVTVTGATFPSSQCRFILADASGVFSPSDFCSEGSLESIRVVIPTRQGSRGVLVAVTVDLPSIEYVQEGDQQSAFLVRALSAADTTIGQRRPGPTIRTIAARPLPSGFEVPPTAVPRTRTFCSGSWCAEGALVYQRGAWAFYEALTLQTSARADSTFYSAVVRRMEASDSLLFRLFGQMTDVDGDRVIAVFASNMVEYGTFYWEDAIGPGPPEASGTRRSTFERFVTFGPGLLIQNVGAAEATEYWARNVTAETSEILTYTHAARLGIAPIGCCWMSGGGLPYESHLGNGSSYLVPFIINDGAPVELPASESYWNRSCFSTSKRLNCALIDDVYYGSGAFWYWLYQRFGPGIVAKYMDARWLQRNGDRLAFVTGTLESVLYAQFLLSLVLDGTAGGSTTGLEFATTNIPARLPGIAASVGALALGTTEVGIVAYTRGWVRGINSTTAIEIEIQWLANRKLQVVVAQY